MFIIFRSLEILCFKALCCVDIVTFYHFLSSGLWVSHWASSEQTNPFLIKNVWDTRLSSSMWTQGTRPRSSIFSAVFFSRKLPSPLFLKSSLVLNIPATPSLKTIASLFKLIMISLLPPYHHPGNWFGLPLMENSENSAQLREGVKKSFSSEKSFTNSNYKIFIHFIAPSLS